MIKRAAVKKGNKMWLGRRHSDCFHSMAASGVDPGRKTESSGIVTYSLAYLKKKSCPGDKGRSWFKDRSDNPWPGIDRAFALYAFREIPPNPARKFVSFSSMMQVQEII